MMIPPVVIFLNQDALNLPLTLGWRLQGHVSPTHAMKAYSRSGGPAPLIIEVGTRWRSAITTRHGHFTPAKAWWVPGLVWIFWR
jgi:hypothetical protein